MKSRLARLNVIGQPEASEAGHGVVGSRKNLLVGIVSHPVILVVFITGGSL